MGLMHNQAVRISSGPNEGIYRVILDEPGVNKTILVKLTEPDSPNRGRGGRPMLASTKSPRKKKPQPLIGSLIWADRSELKQLEEQGLLVGIEIELDQIYYSPPESKADQELFTSRKRAMALFFDYDNLRESIIANDGLGGLVKEAHECSGLSRALIYKLWSLLCRLGLVEKSLRPRRDRCGAPGIGRPCDSGGHKKAGRKTESQRMARAAGKLLPSKQPGMSTEWRHLIMAADRKIPMPKPDFPSRYTKILESQFVKRYREENGVLIPLELKQGEYPNRAQTRRVLMTEVPRLQRLLEKTTKGHFQRSLRGMTGRNWKGVAGPGHTWAIDSTIGDIYLRSSVNRAWIIGRPVVYIIVDVWSTAVVGFYVCLAGPSWDTAKVSLFSAAADPALLADLWQYQPILSLYPYPTMPAVLMCDRGEYLSRAASQTGIKLIPCLSYAPPYRPDMKGLVEVLHRIEKDRQYLWVPGAIDARRAEYELRRFNPHDAVLTVREYTEYLHTIFAEYNLTANRVARLDTHMIAAGVMPSPAGLWRWGHEVGIGTRRAHPLSELVTSLLPSQTATVSRAGVRFCGLHYESEVINEEQWTAHARNFGSWNIEANHFPGSVSRIWTPNVTGAGLLDLRLSQQALASSEQTSDEVLDAFMIGKLNRSEWDHFKVLRAMASRQRLESLVAGAKILTGEAIDRYLGAVPTLTESRQMEASSGSAGAVESDSSVKGSVIDEAQAAYLEMMKDVMAAANGDGT